MTLARRERRQASQQLPLFRSSSSLAGCLRGTAPSQRRGAGSIATPGENAFTSDFDTMSQAEEAESESREEETADPREFGLTQKGCQAAVGELGIEALPRGRTSSIISLTDMYAHLIKRGRCEKAELLKHFTGVDAHPRPENGRYTRADNWWGDMGRNLLAQLPGVEVDGANEPGATEVVRFTGLGEARDEFDDDHVVTLAELRGVKDHATNVLADLGVGIDRREQILSLHPAPLMGP